MTEPLWLSVARAFVGEREIPGPVSNPVILRWAHDLGAPAWFDNDDLAWCAVFLNRILLACQLPRSGTGFELLRAKTFETWGKPCLEPMLGAVLVFSRPEGAHVALYVGQTPDAFRVLGGNQSNAVGYTWIEKRRLTAIRWPLAVPYAATGPILLQADGSLISHNEA